MTGLVISNACVNAGGKTIIDNVSLTAQPSQITGLVGPNGAGKSTLMRAALGLVPLASGVIAFDGENLPAMPRRRRAQTSSFVEQTGAAESHLTSRDVVMLGRIPFQSVWQTEPSAQDIEIVAAALTAVGMAGFEDRSYRTLSGGEQQRLQIARALAQQPRLLLLDEPTNHLDIHAQLSVLSVLRTHSREGSTILMALHDLNLAASFCDSLAVLHQGVIIDQGAPEHVITPALLRQVYRVEASVMMHPASGRPLVAFHGPL